MGAGRWHKPGISLVMSSGHSTGRNSQDGTEEARFELAKGRNWGGYVHESALLMVAGSSDVMASIFDLSRCLATARMWSITATAGWPWQATGTVACQFIEPLGSADSTSQPPFSIFRFILTLSFRLRNPWSRG